MAICRGQRLRLPLGPICILDRVRHCLIEALLGVCDTPTALFTRELDGLLDAVAARPRVRLRGRGLPAVPHRPSASVAAGLRVAVVDEVTLVELHVAHLLAHGDSLLPLSHSFSLEDHFGLGLLVPIQRSDVHGLDPVRIPPCVLRDALDRSGADHARATEHDVLVGAPVVAQEGPFAPSFRQLAVLVVLAVLPRVMRLCQALLSEPQCAPAERPSPEAFVGRAPVDSSDPGVQHPCNVLHKPPHRGVAARDAALQSLLQARFHGPQEPLHLLDPVLDAAVALRVVGRRALLSHLVNRLHIELLQRLDEELACGRLLVASQEYSPVAGPQDVVPQPVHGEARLVDTFLGHDVREDDLAEGVLGH